MSENGQTRFKNLAANAARFSKCVWSFSRYCEELRLHSQFTSWIITFREYSLIYSERPVAVLLEFGPVNKVYLINILTYVDSKLE